MNGERWRYYIVEHPTRGVLRDLEETEAGNVGRFSAEGSRADAERCERFPNVHMAVRAIMRITPASKATGCQVRCSQWEGNGNGYNDAWPVVWTAP